MNKSIVVVVLIVVVTLAVLINDVRANCGCLKCSKHLTVISPPHEECKIIYRDSELYNDYASPTPLPYGVQLPAMMPPVGYLPKNLDYKVGLPYYHNEIKHKYLQNAGSGAMYNVQVQMPLPLPSAMPCTYLKDLVAKPDRIIIPRPAIVYPGRSDYPGGYASIWGAIPSKQYVTVGQAKCQPIIQKLPEDFYRKLSCDCRYGTTTTGRRTKRSLVGGRDGSDDLIKSSVALILDFLPNFIKTPLRHTLKNWKKRQEIENRWNHRHDHHHHHHYNKHPNKKYSVGMTKPWKPPPNKYVLMRKLQKLNSDSNNHHSNRVKRSHLMFDTADLRLPFYHIDSDETSDESTSQEDENDISSSEEQSEESSSRRHPTIRHELLEPFHAGHLIPHNPIFYLLNAPIRFLHHVHNLGRQITPVFKSVPHVLVNSRKYLRDFGRHFKNDVLTATSDLIGDFDDFGTIRNTRRYRRSTVDDFEPNFDDNPIDAGRKSNREWLRKLTGVVKLMRKKSKKRAVVTANLGDDEPGTGENSTANVTTTKKLEPYEPEYSLVFGQHLTESHSRPKRYILKVVDEDEVHDFLRDRLSRVYGDKSKRPPKVVEPHSREKKVKKKLKVKKLTPKLILDNNGFPFMEINGKKRPLLPKRQLKKDKIDVVQAKKEDGEEQVEESKTEEDMQTRITNLIEKARKIDPEQVKAGVPPKEVSSQVIRDKLGQILTEIENLINTDFNEYATINKNLAQLENLKDFLVDDWKNVLVESKINEIGSKIRILDNFKGMQSLKDECVKSIASVLDKGSNFMSKRLIKTLVRLQKLQCVIYRVVDDFGEKIKMGTLFDADKETKYVDYLGNLRFSADQNDLEKILRHERDLALEQEMKLLEDLRHLIENPSDHQIQDEARLLWEIKNIEKLRKNAIAEMNAKISQGHKVRKELKILFDLLKQQDNCEQRQTKLLQEIQPDRNKKHRKRHHHHHTKKSNRMVESMKPSYAHTIIEDKKPVRIVSNGYKLNAYKFTDDF